MEHVKRCVATTVFLLFCTNLHAQIFILLLNVSQQKRSTIALLIGYLGNVAMSIFEHCRTVWVLVKIFFFEQSI